MRLNLINKISVSFLLTGLCLVACAPANHDGAEVPDASIVHGSTVRSENEISRSMVALVMAGAQGQSLCSGTILDEQTILTAAHCVDHDLRALIIVFGTKVHAVPAALQRLADRAVQHPYWQRSGMVGDVALVHFNGGLPDGFRPVELAHHEFPLSLNNELRMVGYGISNPHRHSGAGTLRQTSSRVIGFPTREQFAIDERMSGACFGDSDGPAFAILGNRAVQVGIAHSSLNESCNAASVYTGVMPYANWIRQGTLALRNRR